MHLPTKRGINQKTLFSCNYSGSTSGFRRRKNYAAFRMPQTWASKAGGKGAVPPCIFIHGIDIVDRGLSAIFWSFFRCPPPLRKRLNSAIFQSFLLFFGIFPLPPLLEIFLLSPWPQTAEIIAINFNFFVLSPLLILRWPLLICAPG